LRNSNFKTIICSEIIVGWGFPIVHWGAYSALRPPELVKGGEGGVKDRKLGRERKGTSPTHLIHLNIKYRI